MLADGEMHPAFIQNSACHKHWDLSVNYIKPSLSKALQANNLLSGNNPDKGWGSMYSSNPRSVAPFLPKQSVKSLPSSVQVSQHRRPSVIVSTNTYTKGPSIVVDSLSKKHPYVSDQAEFKKVRLNKNISKKSQPNFLSLDTLAKLQQSG